MEGSKIKKILALTLGIIMLTGLIPYQAKAASSIDLVAGRNTTGVTAVLSNYSTVSVDALLILAGYKSDGKLSHVEQFTVTAGAGADVIWKYDFAAIDNPTYIYKVFAWDPTTFVPLCEAATAEDVFALCVTVDGSGAEYNGLYVAAPVGVTEFMYVKVDEVRKIGVAYTAEKGAYGWTHTKVQGADVIIAYKPASVVGGSLPTATMSVLDTRVSNNANKIRIVISL